MKLVGITGVLRRKTTRTTVADPAAERFPDRIQRAWSQTQRPDQWWVDAFGYLVPVFCVSGTDVLDIGNRG